MSTTASIAATSASACKREGAAAAAAADAGPGNACLWPNACGPADPAVGGPHRYRTPSARICKLSCITCTPLGPCRCWYPSTCLRSLCPPLAPLPCVNSLRPAPALFFRSPDVVCPRDPSARVHSAADVPHWPVASGGVCLNCTTGYTTLAPRATTVANCTGGVACGSDESGALGGSRGLHTNRPQPCKLSCCYRVLAFAFERTHFDVLLLTHFPTARRITDSVPARL